MKESNRIIDHRVAFCQGPCDVLCRAPAGLGRLSRDGRVASRVEERGGVGVQTRGREERKEWRSPDLPQPAKA